jgi:hypothetical protein
MRQRFLGKLVCGHDSHLFKLYCTRSLSLKLCCTRLLSNVLSCYTTLYYQIIHIETMNYSMVYIIKYSINNTFILSLKRTCLCVCVCVCVRARRHITSHNTYVHTDRQTYIYMYDMIRTYIHIHKLPPFATSSFPPQNSPH